eukprot:g3513.t1
MVFAIHFFAVTWGFGGSMNYENRVRLSVYISQLTTVELPPGVCRNESDLLASGGTTSALDTVDSLLNYNVELDGSDCKWQSWSELVPTIVLESQQVLATDVVVPTMDTVRHRSALHAWLAEHKPLILCGPPGSGKTMTLTATLQSMPECVLVSLNFSSASTPDLILKTFAQYCEYSKTPNGTVLKPQQVGKWLVVFCDEINLPANDRYGTQRVITFMRQLTTRGGFWRSRKNSIEWVRIERIQFVGACNPPTDPGRVPLSLRFLANAPVLLVDYPAPISLKQIYGTFGHALLKLQPTLRSFHGPLTNALVSFYLANQRRFLPDNQPHYVYSPRELSRWIRALYEAMVDVEHMTAEAFVRLWAHEGLRLFHDRLVTAEEREWCQRSIDNIARDTFPSVDLDQALKRPILFSTWMSKRYQSVGETELRTHIEARLKDFHEEELSVKLVVFNDVLDHVLRIDRVLRQPVGHLLLVGESGAGKTVLSRFVAWMNGLSVFQIKVSRRYTIENFDDDLREILKRAGCEGEKICFIFDESNVLSSAFLERMNALLASGEVPGLFEADEFAALMTQCRDCARRDGVIIDTDEELFRRFTREVQRNLHVVFTMNPANSDFGDRTATSPALFNRCVVDWFGDWSNTALAQVGHEFTRLVDLDSAAYDASPRAQLFVTNSQEWLLSQRAASRTSAPSKEADDDALGRIPCSRHLALVGSIVQIHLSVRQLIGTLARKEDQRLYISPRDYLDFIHHFVSIFNEKQSDLEEQQLHLNIGLDKIRKTEEQVAKLRVKLESKDKELVAKNKEANEKLKQMLEDKNSAEKKKEDAEKLGKELEEREAHIASRRKMVDADLAKAEPALIEARASVKNIRKSQLTELASMARPPKNVRLTMEAVALMIGNVKSPDDLKWGDIRKIINRTDFITSVCNFKTDILTHKTRKVVMERYVDNDDLTYEKALRGSKAAGPLYKWVESQVSFAEILNKVKPLKMEAEKLEAEAVSTREEYKSLTSTISELEARISKLKEEYAELIAQTEAIKQEMKDVKTKVERSTKLLQSLAQESTRWEGTSSTFREQVATVAGDTLRSAAFVTYLGWFGYQHRRLLMQRWYEILEDFGIEQRDDLSFVQYLSKPSERLAWRASELPSDGLCNENASILTRYNRFPLVIDPSGQASAFLMKYFQKRKMKKTSFLDPAFMKTLESALRFGTALLVENVENIDPVLNPVLNREVQLTGGRRLVRVGDQEVDFSPSFTMFMTTRDPTHQFSPDLCSRVTFVNFTVTPASLEAQCLSTTLQSERPDIEEKRVNLLKLQGQYQARLRELEESLLSALNASEGNILDDDNVMVKLETLKKEAAQVRAEVDRTEEVMREVNDISEAYKPLAVACSRIYFGMDRLSELHYLYHFSLNFFLDIVSSVLETGKAEKKTSSATKVSGDRSYSHVDGLLRCLFSCAFRRISQGILESDRLVFAMSLAQIYVGLKPSGGKEIGSDELDFVLGRKATMSSQATSANDVLPDSALTALQRSQLSHLSTLSGFSSMLTSMRQNSEEWTQVLRSSPSDAAFNPPASWIDPSESKLPTEAFRWVLVLKTIRPDAMTEGARRFVTSVFGHSFLSDAASMDLRQFVAEVSTARSPVMLCSTPGFDASAYVEALAKESSKTARITSVSMGSSEGFDMATKSIDKAIASGSWVMLKNVHLCPTWLKGLEKRIYTLNAARGFRLFLTAEINPSIPMNLCRLSHVMLFEAPSGVKASLRRSLASIDEKRMERAPSERSRLYFLLAWFHAVVLERRRFCPVGWTKSYGFGDSDRKCSLNAIDYWIDACAKGKSHVSPDAIPWKALQTLLAQTMYGGRIDNKFDDFVLTSFVERLFVPSSFDADFALCDAVTAPESTSKAACLKWLETLPDANTPEWLGLPSTAQTQLLTNCGETLLSSFCKMQSVDEDEDAATNLFTDSAMDDDGVGGEREDGENDASSKRSAADLPSWMSHAAKIAAEWLKLLPTISPLQRRAASINSPLFRCMEREIEVGRALLDVVRADLESTISVCEGKTKVTNRTRAVMRNISKGLLPQSWKASYSLPEVSASNWMTDLGRRLKQFANVVEIARTKPIEQRRWDLRTRALWLGGLAAPEAFLTATRQSVAETHRCSLQELRLVLSSSSSSDEAKIDRDSFMLSGLSLEGAGWNNDTLVTSVQTTHPLPPVRFTWTTDKTANESTKEKISMEVPVYLNRDRKDLLFVVRLRTSSKTPPAVWRQRGVAITCWSPRVVEYERPALLG